MYTAFAITPTPTFNSNTAFNAIPAFTGTATETEQFWFHPDHLGSSNYITNFVGEVSQHMEYFAFGETFVEEHKNSHNSPYKFNGKELDEESSLYYYGARYYDPRISIWGSVDPLAEKYPSWSPYNYCFSNPIKLVDPNGEDPIVSGLIEAASAFVLSAGMDFLSAYLLEGKNAKESFGEIGWFSASYDAGMAWAQSSLVPGTATATRVSKLAKTTVGKVLIAVLTKVALSTMDAYSKGKFNDENGDFSFDKFKDEMKDIFIESTAQGLLDTGFKGAAEKFIRQFAKENDKLSKMLRKLDNKVNNGESISRVNKYAKKVEKQIKAVEKTQAKYIQVKATEEVGTAVSGKVISKKVKDETK